MRGEAFEDRFGLDEGVGRFVELVGIPEGGVAEVVPTVAVRDRTGVELRKREGDGAGIPDLRRAELDADNTGLLALRLGEDTGVAIAPEVDDSLRTMLFAGVVLDDGLLRASPFEAVRGEDGEGSMVDCIVLTVILLEG